MTDTHSKHSPSSLPAKELCPGWKSDPTPGPMAMRGTAIHGHIAALISGPAYQVPAEYLTPVETALEIMRGLNARFPDHKWEAEVKLDTGIPDVYGTGDVVGVSEWSPTGVLVDWKTGRGERDDAGTSIQTAAYGIGMLKRYPWLLEVVIIMGELEQAATEALWLRKDLERTEQRIRDVVVNCEAHGEDPRYYEPQPKACQYCARRTHCPALAKNVSDTAQRLPAVASVRDLSPADLSAALMRYRPAGKLVADFLDALEERAKAILAAGGEVPGFALKESNGTRSWTAPDDVVRSELAAQFPGLSLDMLASPAEAEKRIAERLGTKGAKKQAADAIKGMCKPQVRKSLVEAQ